MCVVKSSTPINLYDHPVNLLHGLDFVFGGENSLFGPKTIDPSFFLALKNQGENFML